MFAKSLPLIQISFSGGIQMLHQERCDASKCLASASKTRRLKRLLGMQRYMAPSNALTVLSLLTKSHTHRSEKSSHQHPRLARRPNAAAVATQQQQEETRRTARQELFLQARVHPILFSQRSCRHAGALVGNNWVPG